jgi:hypothetical protein
LTEFHPKTLVVIVILESFLNDEGLYLQFERLTWKYAQILQ